MHRFTNGITVLLVGVLSVTLWMSRRHGAELSAELAQSTEAFVSGAPLPPLALQSTDRMARLDSLCDGRRMLVYFHRRDCPACAKLDRTWGELGGGADVALHLVHLDGLPPESASPADVVSHWSALPLGVMRDARVRTVPAVLAVGPDCKMIAAGAGVRSATMIIQRFPDQLGR